MDNGSSIALSFKSETRRTNSREPCCRLVGKRIRSDSIRNAAAAENRDETLTNDKDLGRDVTQKSCHKCVRTIRPCVRSLAVPVAQRLQRLSRGQATQRDPPRCRVNGRPCSQHVHTDASRALAEPLAGAAPPMACPRRRPRPRQACPSKHAAGNAAASNCMPWHSNWVPHSPAAARGSSSGREPRRVDALDHVLGGRAELR